MRSVTAFIRSSMPIMARIMLRVMMSQYYPTFKAYIYKELSNGIMAEEYKNIVEEAHLLGLNNGWIQEHPARTDPKFLGTNIKPKANKRKGNS